MPYQSELIVWVAGVIQSLIVGWNKFLSSEINSLKLAQTALELSLVRDYVTNSDLEKLEKKLDSILQLLIERQNYDRRNIGNNNNNP